MALPVVNGRGERWLKEGVEGRGKRDWSTVGPAIRGVGGLRRNVRMRFEIKSRFLPARPTIKTVPLWDMYSGVSSPTLLFHYIVRAANKITAIPRRRPSHWAQSDLFETPSSAIRVERKFMENRTHRFLFQSTYLPTKCPGNWPVIGIVHIARNLSDGPLQLRGKKSANILSAFISKGEFYIFKILNSIFLKAFSVFPKNREFMG